VAGEQFGYAFDTIGNRTQTQTGGDTNGLNLRVANYTVNSLNQITQRDVPGTNDIVGAALLGTNVTVNGVAVVDRKAEFFHGTVGTNNAPGAAWLPVTVTGAGNSTAGHLYVAQEPEQFLYDLDGNLTNDGRWAYFWDGENRLVRMTNNTGVGPLYGLSFAYDSKGRRIQKIVTTNGVAFTTNTFIYDGWNLVAEVGASGSLVRAYTWGTDLSGSQQGAGGVGGLLEVSYHGTSTTNAFVAYDGNGNVTALVNVLDGTLLANYDYGPFGEVIRATGPMAKVNPFRFSTKYQDDESDLLYYGHRYYKPTTGTWLNRDPIEERSFRNMYVNSSTFKEKQRILKLAPNGNAYLFLKNDSPDHIDAFGLCPRNTCDKWQITIVSQASVDYAGGVVVHAQLQADPTCCMDKYEAWQYNYYGMALGFGLDATMNINVGSKKFSTPCVGWSAHNGPGRVTGIGAGVILTYGSTVYTTPQAYFEIHSLSWGVDASLFTSIGWWHMFPENGPGTEQE
jgi:RHS repeat-associated protein